MALRITTTDERQLLSSPVLKAVRSGLTQRGQVVVFCSSFSQALQLHKELAAQGILLAVKCTTISAWLSERWEVWGNGCRVIDGLKRSYFAGRVLQEQSSSEVLPGMVNLLSNFAAAYSGLLSREQTLSQPSNTKHSVHVDSAIPATSLTPAEQDFLVAVEDYRSALDEAGYIEESEAMTVLPSLLRQNNVTLPALVAVGLDTLSRTQQQFFCQLARLSSLDCIFFETANPACDMTRQLISELSAEARKQQVDISHEAHNSVLADPTQSTAEGPIDNAGSTMQNTFPDCGRTAQTAKSPRAFELETLLHTIFVSSAAQLKPTGAVSLVLPAGPLAEAEALASRIVELAQGGARDIVVCAPDTQRFYRELVPKLLVRGLSVRSEQTIAFRNLWSGRTFLTYLQSIAQLATLAETWPQPRRIEEGTQVVLGDMDWWPPKGISDFLMSGLSQVPAEAARQLDRQWRGNRLLTPAQVLADLQSEKKCSRTTALTTRALLEGRTKRAAFYLREGVEQSMRHASVADRTFSRSMAEQKAVVDALLEVAAGLEELGIETLQAKETSISLEEYATYLGQFLSARMVRLRLDEQPAQSESPASAENDQHHSEASPVPDTLHDNSLACVRLLSFGTATRLGELSCDALVICQLTSQETPIERDPALAAFLAERLALEKAGDPMVRSRAQFAALLQLPRKHLVLERSLFTTEGKDAYSAVMLVELLASYGVAGSDKPKSFLKSAKQVFGQGLVGERSETEVPQNVSSAGQDLRVEVIDTPASAGVISAELMPYVVVPPSGQLLDPHEPPLLSASQIETYLECPYKWFSLRRLRLSDADASFGPAEMGTFAHRVLELTHGQLSEEHHSVHDVTSGLPRAHELLDQHFADHLRHQYLLRGHNPVDPQALIAHGPRESAQLDALRDDLHSLFDYEADRLLGFEPQQFEWSFGRGSEVVEYAGARLVGTIDRVDVDAHGQALVIDYKHKSAAGFAREYDVFGQNTHEKNQPLGELRRVQSLIYAQVIRRYHPELRVVGALYLCTRAEHVLAGAADSNLLERIYGQELSSARRKAVGVDSDDDFGRDEQIDAQGLCADHSEQADAKGLDGLLDATENVLATYIQKMRAGDITAHPLDDAACQWCPVLNCEKRRA